MTATLAAYVAIGGFAGACARYGINVWMSRLFPSKYLLATLFVNLSGSLLFGMLAGSAAGNSVSGLLGTGFLGAYTTFSTYIMEIVNLAKGGFRPKAAWYGAAGIVLGIGLSYIGYLFTAS